MESVFSKHFGSIFNPSSPVINKEDGEKLTSKFTFIINYRILKELIMEGIFADIWKTALLLLILKSGNKDYFTLSPKYSNLY